MQYEKPVADLRQELGNTIEQVKQKYGLLLDLRERRIAKLEGELAKAPRERPKSRLLVVDDAESTVAVLQRYLAGERVELLGTAGEGASSHLDSGPYDGIMVEATSAIAPDADGLSLCRTLCEAGKGAQVIVMSSRPGEDIQNSVEQAGARFLRKPFRRDQLVKLVRDMLLQDRT